MVFDQHIKEKWNYAQKCLEQILETNIFEYLNCSKGIFMQIKQNTDRLQIIFRLKDRKITHHKCKIKTFL